MPDQYGISGVVPEPPTEVDLLENKVNSNVLNISNYIGILENKVDYNDLNISNYVDYNDLNISNYIDYNDLKLFCKEEWPHEEEKSNAILTLQIINKNDFYKDMKKMGHV